MMNVPVAIRGGSGSTPPVVTLSGSNTSTASSTTITFTVPAAGIPAGAAIIVGCSSGATTTLSTVTDTKSNTYTVDKDSGGLRASHLASCPNCIALVSGDVITATFSGTTASKQIVVIYVTGMKTASIQDIGAVATATSTTPSATTGATTNGSDLVVGVVAWQNAPTVSVEGAGYTTLGGDVQEGANSGMHLAYKIVSVTGAQTYAPTLSGSNQWGECVEAYKGL